MIGYIAFAVAGYLLGSILFALIFGYLFAKKDIRINTIDSNPGTFNAFAQGGIVCGIFSLICDMGKGFLPVFLCLHYIDYHIEYNNEYLMALVMIAPVLGHVFPVFNKFRGGKGIATSFGVLLAFVPDLREALPLALVFIFFSVVLIIRPDFYKTLVTYFVASVVEIFLYPRKAVLFAYVAMTIIVCIRLVFFDDEEEKQSYSLSLFKWQLIKGKERSS